MTSGKMTSKNHDRLRLAAESVGPEREGTSEVMVRTYQREEWNLVRFVSANQRSALPVPVCCGQGDTGYVLGQRGHIK